MAIRILWEYLHVHVCKQRRVRETPPGFKCFIERRVCNIHCMGSLNLPAVCFLVHVRKKRLVALGH